jgi:HD-GYP domain-containing protein (c-di-GMP phosphodiesterase class II)
MMTRTDSARNAQEGSAGDASVRQEELFEAARDRLNQPLQKSELRAELLGAAMLALSAAGLIVWSPPGAEPPLAIALVVAYALASNIRFDIGTGFTVPTQLVLVPMLLLTPPSLVPLLVIAGIVLSDAPAYLAGRRHPSRGLVSFGDALHAVGPAAVLIAAGSPAPDLGEWPLYVVALIAQFGVDFAAMAARERYAYAIPIREQVEDAAWIWSVDALLSPIALVAVIAGPQDNLVFLTLLPLLGLLALFARERRGRLQQALELRNAYLGTTILLADLIEEDDQYTGAHSQGVVSLAVAVADELSLNRWQRRRTEYAARLHDVGKIAVPKEIINKAGPLDADEWRLVRQHTVEGERMLARIGGALSEVGAIVRGSHERWDGTGYPDGLAGESIPIEARIVACCDAFDAMTTDRAYRAALPRQVAVAELREGAGSQFDPSVAEALIRVVSRDTTPTPSPEAAVTRD